MASLRALPALKEGTLEAAIFIFWPVWGFLPSLALRCRTENLPKPVILTSSPPLSVSLTTRSKTLKCLRASLVGTSASLAILSISSVLFMVFPFWCRLWFSGGPLGFLGPVCTRRGGASHPHVVGGFGRTDPMGGVAGELHHIWHQ